MAVKAKAGAAKSAAPAAAAMVEGYIPAAPDLARKFTELAKLRDQIDQWDVEMAAAKARLNQLVTVEIPDLMIDKYDGRLCTWRDAQSREWLFDCAEIAVSGSLPKENQDRRKAAIAWLEENEGGALIRTKVGLDFAREQHDEAIRLAKQLEKKGLPVSVDSGVHAQTLCAWARERIRNGEPVDGDVLGLYIGRKTKYKVVNIGQRVA